MRRLGYARKSTADQSLDLQIDALKAAGCDQIFEDIGSGARQERVGLRGVLATLERGDTLVVWRLDRLGRSLSNLIELINGFEKRGIEFQSLQESLDTRSSAGRLLFHLMGAMAQFERDLIRERTKAGMKAASDRGVKMGRPKLLSDGSLCAEQISNLRGRVSRATWYRYVRRLADHETL